MKNLEVQSPSPEVKLPKRTGKINHSQSQICIKLIRIFLFLVIFAACGDTQDELDIISQDELDIISSSARLAKGPYVKNVTMDSITILWETNIPGPAQVVYGMTPHYTNSVEGYSEEVDPLLDEPIYINRITIEGLSPSTEYHYQVTPLYDPTPDYVFRTAVWPDEPFVFVVYGDNRPWVPFQNTVHEPHQDVLNAIMEVKPDLVINTGDIVNEGFFSIEWDMLFEVLEPMITSVPYYAAFGNHEIGGEDQFNAYFPGPADAEDHTYYSFDYGNSHFVILNTCLSYKSGGSQYQWLEADLKVASENPDNYFKFVFFHYPPYSSSDHGSNLNVRTELCPLFEKYGVDVVFNGHDHVYERTIPINEVTYVVTGGGGAPLYFPGWSEWTAYSESIWHFIKAEVSGDEVVFEAITPSGEVLDIFAIQ